MDEARAARPTRRELLARTARTGAAAATVAGGLTVAGALGPRADTASAANRDADWLAAAYEAKHLAVIAYRHVLALPVLSPRARGIMAKLLAHERAHIAVLAADLRALGAAVPPPPHTIDQVGETLDKHGMNGSLASSASRKDALQLLLDVEALCEGALYRAAGNLSASEPLVHAAQALAADAQHTTVLQGLLHPGDIGQAVSNWYVAGVG